MDHWHCLRRMMETGVCTVAAICVLAGCKSRPPAPPADLEVGPPWGTLRRASLFADDQRASLALERDLDGKPRWPILVLAGTGSRTAFAAGLLGGWSETGERPRFQVVTGVGPAAVLATFAFLGSDYDQTLNSMYVLETREVYRRLGLVTTLNEGALYSPKPLRQRLEERISDAVLDAVAAEHATGRRLYVGTTNLDTNKFVIWDMGAIASSERRERRERYVDVLMASGSPPPTYPPVYIEVDAEDESSFWHAHVDGGVKEPAFLRSFMMPPRELIQRSGVDPEDVRIEIYVILGDQLSGRSAYAMPVRQNLNQLTQANVMALRATAINASLYRVNAQVSRHGLRVRFAAIPARVESLPQPGVFQPDKLQSLFDDGYAIGASGDTWTDLDNVLALYGLLEEAVP